jgi:glycosyl transferase family 2
MAASPFRPPERVRTVQVFERADWVLFVILTALNLAVVTLFLRRWLAYDGASDHPVQFVALTVWIAVAIAMYEARWLALPVMRRPVPMEAPPGLRVGVATTFVPSAEPLEMLSETVAGLVAMDYPHDTWVLDEGDDPAVKELCARLGARHFSRAGRREYQTDSGTFERRSKHGNYNAWLHEVGFDSYDVIVGFDPDHVPHRDFLLRTLGYLKDPAVGYVQAAQVYYNQPAGLVARGAAEDTYAYYSSTQMSSYGLGYPIVTGCHHVHRSTALQEVGGFAPHEADDLLITILYRAAGWRGVYVPEVLAEGITPVDWTGYLTQQRRWARSVLDVKFRVFPRVAGKLPLVERATSLLHGLYALHGLAAALGLSLLTWTLLTGSGSEVWGHLYTAGLLVVGLVLQLCDFFRHRFFLQPRAEGGLPWRAVLLRQAKWPTVLVALVDASRPRRTAYTITSKSRQSRRLALLLVVPHSAVVLVVGTAMLVRPALDVVHVLAALSVTVSLVLLATTLRPSPAPYDRALSERRRSQPSSLNRRLTTAAPGTARPRPPNPPAVPASRGAVVPGASDPSSGPDDRRRND